MPVSVVFENLQDGLRIEDVAHLFDGVSVEQIQELLVFTARTLSHRITMRILLDQGTPLPLALLDSRTQHPYGSRKELGPFVRLRTAASRGARRN